MNFDNFKYKKDKNKGPYEQLLYMEELKKEFIDDMTTNEKYKVFFDKCDPDTIPGFILAYVEAKLHLITCYSVIIDQDKISNNTTYSIEALDKFNWIKQKKLWDLQLLWRAERIEIDEVEICYDFQYWENNIESCPFLPPITEREVELLKEYLKIEDKNDIYRNQIEDWQDYDNLMEKDEYDLYSYCPEFYQYFDDHLFTSYLLNLPNVRGEKEEFYANLKRDKNRKEAEENALKTPQVSKEVKTEQETLYYSCEKALEYAELYEKDPHYVELFKLWRKDIANRSESNNEEEFMLNNIDILKEAEVPVYMQTANDWKISLENSVQDYENEMVIEQLDSVYEEYKMYAELKITSGKSVKQIIEERTKDYIRELYEHLILDGRELNGEPRDFNF